MSRVLFRCDGGEVVLPDRSAVLATRLDGGNLLVNPPRPVWERGELTPDECRAIVARLEQRLVAPTDARCRECA